MKDATELADELRTKTDLEVVFATLAAVRLAADQAPAGSDLDNLLSAARASLVVLVERFVPRELADEALELLYGDHDATSPIGDGDQDADRL